MKIVMPRVAATILTAVKIVSVNIVPYIVWVKDVAKIVLEKIVPFHAVVSVKGVLVTVLSNVGKDATA